MPTRKQLLIFAIAVTVALLAGYIPQFLRARGLSGELESARQELRACELRARMSELRDLMGLAYVEVNQKNYGLAGQHAARFFDRAGQVRGEVTDTGQQSALDQALAARDEITAGLARGDAAVAEPIQRIYQALVRLGQPGVPQG